MATFRFVWAEGQLALASGFGRTHHYQILQKMIQNGQLPPGQMPENYVAGNFTTDDLHGGQFDRIEVLYGGGTYPDDNELKYLIRSELNGYGRESALREYIDRLAKGSEDTEPAGSEVGFLKDPHDTLYPLLFDGMKMKPDVIKKIKEFVLDAIAKEYKDADKFIYFTAYGDCLSYGWSEKGDLDLQMWVDISKYDGKPTTQDDLVADIRRIVGPINFPTFNDLGIHPPKDSDLTGDMMVQYYAKPGTGSKEENLAQRPYACYDMETHEWYVKPPKEVNPEWYAERFLRLRPQAEDIALQAEGLISELQRHVLSWQFWRNLYDRYDKPLYKKEYEDAQKKAEQEKAGIKVLFDNIFGGRAKAYSPEGEGLYDDRDTIQKLLEVWDIFQELKTNARQALPWEEQELPANDLVEDVEEQDENDGHDDDEDRPNHMSSITRWTMIVKESKWGDIMEKAKRLLDNGQVHIEHNLPDYAEATVQGDHGTYKTQIWRDDPTNGSITMWTCGCPWSEYSWGRTRQWKKFEGRPCAHTLALYWQSLSTPLDTGGTMQAPQQQGEQMSIPGMGETRPQSPELQPYDKSAIPPMPPNLLAPSGPGQPNLPVMQQPQEVGFQAPPKPIQSQPLNEGEAGPLEFPGTLSRVTSFSNGDTVRTKVDMQGTDRDGATWPVPRNSSGEVLYSDDIETIAIFPLNTGPLESHLVKVEGPTANFMGGGKAQPFVKRRSTQWSVV